ncbi:MAG TPA: ABC transporter ATP-binding protein [Vicinamibacteria bacterium]|nr:ABC transporter ATP-binding protein [Vicinamibacteria bacterium]
MDASRVAVRLRDVHRHFGDVRAVDGVSLEIRDGEFFSMLGPSGSGKTTCLRLIAGFDQPTRGEVELFDAQTAGVPPWERDVNTVFQDYALFPHMDVAENVAYGLRVKGVPRAERERRVAEALDMVRLPGVAARRPAQLSGGQRQRVALARALVNRPRVLLLDEPLGALDLKLRQDMQGELKALQQRLGITFVYVTHDQEEALAMSDRLAVFSQGRVDQVGTPAAVYEDPATAFVAGFVGVANQLEGELARSATGSPEPFSIRPEKLRRLQDGEAAPAGHRIVSGRVAETLYHGAFTRYAVETEGGRLAVVEQNRAEASDEAPRAGLPVRIVWPVAAERRRSRP